MRTHTFKAKKGEDLRNNPTVRAVMAGVIVYLCEVDAGTDNACWVVCAKGDSGAVLFTPSV